MIRLVSGSAIIYLIGLSTIVSIAIIKPTNPKKERELNNLFHLLFFRLFFLIEIISIPTIARRKMFIFADSYRKS